jgi:peptidoglycan hydrolase CwlO-like protein
MLLSSNELDMLILQHGKDGTSADSKYIWVKYAQDKNGTDLTDDPTNAVYIGIAYNKTEKHESDNPNDYTWTRIKGNDGESAYTVILQNENITFSVSNQNNIALMDQSFDTSVVVFKGTDAVSNFTIGTVESKNGISVIQKNNTITFSVEAGNKIEADYGKFSIPISVNGLVFKKEVSWSLAKAGAVGGQGNPGEPALSISLGNESQNIPCTYDGHVINDMLIEISFVGYRGLTRTPCNVAVGTLPSGMTLGSTENCTISNDGSIILNIVKNATLGTELTLTGNIVLTFSINGKTLVKNFTWTKSKDGGLSYIYSIEPSSYVINKTYDGTLSPASITFNAYYQKDGSDRIPYHGLFTIEESTTGSDFKSTYLSSKNESSLTYTPTSNNIKSVRCTLSQTDKVSVVLDRQTVIVLSDDKMKDALTTVTTRVNGVSSKVDGIDKKITNKVWQTDITTAVNNYDGTTVKSLRDQVSSQETKIGEITSEVSDVKTTVKNNQASVQKDIASIKQDATGFKQTVASTYETKNDATSKYSSFDQRAGKIETNVKTLQGNVTTLSQTDTEIKAELKTAKGDITTLKSDASGLSTKITNAQGDVNILKADAKTMKSDISDAKGNISELQRTSTNLQSQITNNNTNINILSRDPMNYSQLKEDTADYFGFTYDNTADGKWYTVKTLSRDKFISGYYECMGGESFNIEFEISTSVKGNSTNEGTDSTYKGTAIGLYGFNAQKQSVGINYSARTTATAAATATKISSVVSVPVNSRYFRVFLQTESWGNFSGTLKIRNVIVSRIKAMETRISSAETAIQQNTNDISLRATNVQLDQVKKEINGNFANYSTTTEMNSAINQAANSITLDVSKKYTEKTVYDQGIADAKKDATTKADNALNSAKADATSKANKAESNAKADTANKLKNYSTTTEMNSAIKVKADSITQEVSKTYTKQTDFNSLYIGGRNLARNTSSSYSSEFSGFSGAANICPSVATVLTDGLAAGDEITIHLYYNYSNIVAATGQTAKVWIQGSGNVTGWSSGVFPSSPSIAISGSGTKEFLYTTTVSEDQIKNSYWLVNLRHDYVQSGTVRWKMFKVEKGNRHSEWSPAPEDTSAAITKVEQTATGIRADLSNTQGDISSLQATASGLQKSISNAQGDINTMKSDATKIKTRISNAEGDISTLQQTANGFQVQLSKKADQVDSFNWNLVPNSYKMNNQWSAAGGFVGTTTVVLDPDALCGYHIEVKCTTAGSGPHYPVFGKTSDKVGKTYTWSFWAKCSANKSSVPVGHECGGIKRIDLTTSWQKYFMTWKYIDAAHSSFTFYATFAVGEILYIRDFKIEEGSIATKWAPAESDLKGEKGDKGDKGDTGASGKGVKSTAVTYQASSSGTTIPTGVWSATPPATSADKPYFWTRTIITYTDNTTSTAYNVGSTPEGIVVGGRNLLVGTHKSPITYTYPTSGYADKYSWKTTVLLNGSVYTLSFWAKSSVNGDKIRVHFYNPSNIISVVGSQGQRSTAIDGLCDFVLTTTMTKYWVTYTIPKGGNSTRSVIIPRLGLDVTGTGTLTFQWEKLEEGNMATDWTPAPEDYVSFVDVEYYLSTSATSLSGGSWSTTAPTWVNGKYMWSRTVTIDGSGNKTYSPNQNGVCIAGAQGATGAKGDKGDTGGTGATGKGVKSIVEQYYKSTSATAMSGGSWSTTYPGWENSKYIWTRSVITYTDNTTSTTTAVCVTGSKGDKGATGGTGPTGNGIKSITEHYAVSTSNSSAPTTWSTAVPTMTETNKYLWNYETITYTNNTTNDTAKRVIGVYGNKGATGEDGKNGTNLWVNPLFESGKPQITRIDTSVTAPNGAAVNILDRRDHQNSSTAFPVFPGHQYRITVHRKRITGSLELNSGIWYITRTSGNAYDTIVAPTSTKDLGNSWQEATYNFTCPSGKSKGSVYFQIEQQTNNITTKWYIANVICVDITGLKGDTGAKGDKGDKGATGSAALQVKRNFSGTYTSVGQITTCGTNDFNRPPFAGDTFICLDGSSNTGTWLVTSVSGGTVNIKLLAYVNSKGATGSKGDKGEKGEKGEADIKCYPLRGGANQLVWSKLGTLISAGDNSNFIINIYTGNGYNGHAQQNSQAEIVIKDGWQASASTTSAFGVSVTRQNCDDLKVQVRATASNKCDVWVYLPWAYSWGTYTIAGKYTSWETSSTTQTTEPITGTLQDLAYRMNSENAAKTATNFMEFTSGNGLQIGNKTDGSWSGYRTKISASAFEIINQAGITLAYYGDKLIQLGKNTKDSVIELCGGLGKIQSKQYYGYQACEMSSDYVALRSTHQAVLTSSTSTGNCMVSAAENTFGATATTTDSTGKTTKQGDIDISDGVVEFSSIRNGYDCAVGVYAGGWSGGTYRGSFSPSKGYTEKVLLGDNGAGQLWDRLMAKNATQIMSDRKAKYDIKPLGADTESQIATMSLDSEHSNANPVDIHSELFDRLQPVQYKMVNDDQRIRFGFVAQDVVDAMKELGIREDELDLVHHDQRVTENGYNDTYGMVYTNLIALITHELQLEKQRRSNLELEVADLRSELETMRDNLSGNTN